MIQSIGQVMLYVNDIEASAQFWKEKMGFERVEKQVQGPKLLTLLHLNQIVRYNLYFMIRRRLLKWSQN